ncbi:hypothetical protein CCR75_001725 [Bremia lactucae]|uniref:J domain-containing protein n=1 Tax=Bremia lactucae TaxID=4779 RepID=A0A976IC30_BRELC|nr:hypothetical protein CCR75_001725 [Bremia lactucae]
MVRLVEYPESSDDEQSDDSNHNLSFDEIPSSTSAFFSCPMPSPKSDEDDEDYAPSMGDASSVTSSVDTDDLDPDNEFDEQQPERTKVDPKLNKLDGAVQDGDIDSNQQPSNGYYYAWKDLQAAFSENPFKRRSVQKVEEVGTEKEAFKGNEPKAGEAANWLDVEAENQATFAPGVADTKSRVRKWASTTHCRTNISPRFSTLFSEDKFSRDHRNSSFQTEISSMHPTIPALSATISTNQKNDSTPFNFTFGAARLDSSRDHASMQSPNFQPCVDVPFVPIEKKSVPDNQDKAPFKPYKFAEPGVFHAFSSNEQPVLPTDKVEMGTPLNSGNPGMKSANHTPRNGEFLFGQAYKHRNFSSTSTFAPEFSIGSNVTIGDPVQGTDNEKKEANQAFAFFATGVAGPQNRSAKRRNRKFGTSSAFMSSSSGSASPLPMDTTSQKFSVSHSIFKKATRTFETPSSSASPSVFLFGETKATQNVHANDSTSARFSNPTVFGPTGGKFEFQSTKASPFHEPDTSSVPTSTFGSNNPFVSSSTDTCGHFMFGNGSSHRFFQSDKTATEIPATNSQFHGLEKAEGSTNNAFQIGSADAKKTSRVRSRNNGLFSHKSNQRKDGNLDSNEPEPSPVSTSSAFKTPSPVSNSSSAMPSPFNMHDRRSRKNARLRHYGQTFPADPMKSSFSNSAETKSCFNAANFSAKKSTTAFNGLQSTFSDSHRNEANSSNLSQPPHSDQPAKPLKEEAHPAFAGSRRILRAALRNVGSRRDGTKSASPAPSSSILTEGDAEMDSEDERDWEELKRLGGVAHCARKYPEAAEYYRQSIEALDSLLYYNLIHLSSAIRTDKAKLHANRAASLLMLMQMTEAMHECRRSIEVDETYACAYLRLGRIQVLLGDTAHAQSNLKTARHLMVEQGGEAKMRDQADYASLLKMETTIKKLTALEGEIMWYVANGDYNQALVHTEKALQLAPRSRKLQVQKGQILLYQRKFDQIVKFCNANIEKHQATQRNLSRTADNGDETSRSATSLMVEKITILGIELGLLWATSWHYQNKVEQAVEVLNALEMVAPCSSHVIQLKRQWQDMKQLKHNGNDHFKRGDYQEAVRFYSEAVQIDSAHQEFCAIIYCNRAAAQMGLGRYHTAILDCNEALQRKPTYPRALLRRARCHVALEMYHEAVKDFERYLREQPKDVATADVCRERNEAKAAIAKARIEASRREAAKKRAEREQHQRRQNCEDDSSRDESRFHDKFRRGSNGSNETNSRHQSSRAGGRTSFMISKTQRRTHYDVLGIAKKATSDQIKKAYRTLALVYHPDKAKTATHADLFKEMTAAYNVLCDEQARLKYDRELMYNRFGNFYED